MRLKREGLADDNAECGPRDKSQRRVYRANSGFLFAWMFAVLISCSGEVEHRHIFFKMETVTEITLSVPRSSDVRPVWRAVDSLLSTYEKRFSVAEELSEVRALNERRAAPDTGSFRQEYPVEHPVVSPELAEMLGTGLAYGDTLDGMFDITVLPLKELWGFCEQCTGEEPLPAPAQIAAAADRVDYRRLRLAGDTLIYESQDISIDAGGIAKGYVLRRLKSLLDGMGITNYLIAAGGDILASGSKRGGAPWRVGVQHPRNRSDLLTAIPLTSGAVVTSGDYERFRIVDNQRYHHIFNPATGYPCAANQSLTIRTEDPVRADILSTGLFCRPASQILEFVRIRDDLECLIVDSAGKIHTSNDALWF